MLAAVSRAPLAKLQAFKRRMGWTFPWASSFGSDFNADFNVCFTEEQQREGDIEYNYRREPAWHAARRRGPVAEIAAMTGTDAATYTRERPGMSAFALEDGVVYHTYSAYARGLDGLWGMYQWLDRAPKGATRRASGGAATTSTTGLTVASASSRTIQLLSLSAPLSGERWCTPCRRWANADDRRLDDVDDVHAHAGTDVARRRRVVPRHVDRDDGGDDAAVAGPDAAALPPGRWRGSRTRLGRLIALVSVGYFFVWTLFGIAVFPMGAALAAIAMQQPALARAEPIAIGVIVLLAGALQFTAWKARHLACCRETPGRGVTLPADARTAVRHGLRLGLHCSCCAGLTTILLVIGVMDLRAMAVVTAAITAERLAPGARAARVIGAVGVAAGLVLIARACVQA